MQLRDAAGIPRALADSVIKWPSTCNPADYYDCTALARNHRLDVVISDLQSRVAIGMKRTASYHAMSNTEGYRRSYRIDKAWGGHTSMQSDPTRTPLLN
jgi:hypothetical protein